MVHIPNEGTANMADHLVNLVCAVGDESRLTPAQCALLAHDLPSDSRHSLIEQLCAAVQQLSRELPGTDSDGMSGKELMAAALERDGRLNKARETIRTQRETIAQLRAENLRMNSCMLQREAQLAWPSVSNTSRRELAASNLAQLQQQARQFQSPLTSAIRVSSSTGSLRTRGRAPSTAPLVCRGGSGSVADSSRSGRLRPGLLPCEPLPQVRGGSPSTGRKPPSHLTRALTGEVSRAHSRMWTPASDVSNGELGDAFGVPVGLGESPSSRCASR